jgi:hypothetical protein
MHGCCCLVTAPTGLERTQDMHTGQWPRGAAPANGSARHAARRLVLQPPSQRGRRETSARRYSQPYAHGEGAHEVTRPLSADGPPTHRTSTADSYPILRQPYSTQQRNTNKRRGCPEMPHAAHNQKPQASKRRRTHAAQRRGQRGSLTHSHTHKQHYPRWRHRRRRWGLGWAWRVRRGLVGFMCVVSARSMVICDGCLHPTGVSIIRARGALR